MNSLLGKKRFDQSVTIEKACRTKELYLFFCFLETNEKNAINRVLIS